MLHIKFSLHTDDVSQKIQACTLQPSHIGKEESLSVLSILFKRGFRSRQKILIFWRETYQSSGEGVEVNVEDASIDGDFLLPNGGPLGRKGGSWKCCYNTVFWANSLRH